MDLRFYPSHISWNLSKILRNGLFVKEMINEDCHLCKISSIVIKSANNILWVSIYDLMVNIQNVNERSFQSSSILWRQCELFTWS